jgi:hypothetical protein
LKIFAEREGANMREQKEWKIDVNLKASISESDIDEIMKMAIEGIENRWANVEEHGQISRGGTISIHADHHADFEFGLDGFLRGMKIFLEDGNSDLVNIKNETIDPDEFDTDCGDRLVQYGLFGKVIY